MTNKIFDVLIVGAGISGLIFAHKIKNSGLNILLIEKSNSVGGRMATRRSENSSYDHGAQFLKLENPELHNIRNEFLNENVTLEWFNKNTQTYYASKSGMTQIAKYLQKDLPIVFSEKTAQINSDIENLVRVSCESGQNYISKKLVLSAPWPQSRELLLTSNIEFPDSLMSLSYHHALVGLFELNVQNEFLTQIKHVEKVSEDIHSISNQKSKEVSPNLCFTVVMTSDFSKANFDLSDDIIQQKITHHFLDWLKKKGSDSVVLKSQIKKWRYSHPERIYTKPFEIVGLDQNIYLIGDAFGGGSIQGAMISALFAASNLSASL